MGILYIVATPIGNLEDIGVRALKILLGADIIACEDTRRTGLLLRNYESRIKNQEWKINDLTVNSLRKLVSFYDEVEEFKTSEITDMIRQNKKVCLVSDSGTPLVADPGFKLVRECFRNNIRVISIPGPTAAISALISSGFTANQFLFLGYPPVKSAIRQKLFRNLKNTFTSSDIQPTIIFYESPHRIFKTLEDLKAVFTDIEIVIARELTKVHEQIIKAKITDILADKIALKGEITLLFRI